MHSDAVDEPVGFEEYTVSSGVGSGTEHALYADRQGSVIWVTEPATGQVVAGYEYDGYGQLTQTAGTLSQPYGYTGREYDAESGLYHYRARAYDPAAGVFVQSDPIGFGSGTRNLYEYVGNNPFAANDPTGLLLNQLQYQQLFNAARANAVPVAAVAASTTSLATRIAQVLSMGATLVLTEDSQKTEDKDNCEPLYGQINYDVNVLRTRYNEFVTDPLGLPELGKNSKQGHVDAFKQRQNHLTGLLRKAHAKGCLLYHPSAPYWAQVILPWFRE
ncbi:MAG: RHS repeat-associated core domain-containing protein [Rhodobacteraceae bacterium]|nr:RHS repeat-associated core domain-containing protein [Paracoccaceae bacterium]